jgi:hypothetical protein
MTLKQRLKEFTLWQGDEYLDYLSEHVTRPPIPLMILPVFSKFTPQQHQRI